MMYRSCQAKAGNKNSPSAWACKAHLEDVPSNVDCGFHALMSASRSYTGATALGTRIPRSATETKTFSIQFLQKSRCDIEAGYIAAMGKERAAIYFGKDLLKSEARHAE